MKLFLRSCALLWVAIPGALALELAGVFTDDMVLQRERPVPVWGTGKPGDQITVSFAGQKRSGKVGPTGRWQISLQPLKASAQPRDVVVVARLEKQTATITNVLVGEVWLGSGQSNMAWPLRNILNLQAIATLPADSQLRLFTVPRLISDTPNSTLTGRWTVSSSATLADFSAVGYFFGRDLRAAKGVPVGIICSAWGGTPVQAWTSQPALERVPQLRKRIVQHDAALANFDPVKAETDYQAALAKHQVAVAEAAAANKPAPQPPARPSRPTATQYSPARLYNGMIAPLVPFALRGVIWYQGENDSGQATLYRTAFPTLIQDWRHAFGHDFPFLFVQITPYKAMPPDIRDAQLFTWRTVPQTAMIVTTDCGDANDIHPRNKEPVGARLALAARAIAYREKVPYSGPVFDSLKIKQSQAVLTFEHRAGGLIVRGDSLQGFTVAGVDKKFVPATATIAGDKIIVTSEQVTQPVAVRFGWAPVPDVNLFNTAGLPATPFRTDDW